MFTTANTTQGTSTTQATTGSFIATFLDNNPSVHEAVSGSTTERIMIFRTVTINHTFTIPSGGLNCDILMIGGGGSASIGGGSGACIVAINQRLPEGTCVVRVGNGGQWNSSDPYLSTNGNDSFIQVANADRYRAKGGGASSGANGNKTRGNDGGCGGGASFSSDNTTQSGGAAVGTNVVTLNDDSTTTTTPTISNTHRFAVMGNAGGNNAGNYTDIGSGGGIGGPGVPGGNGGHGAYQVSINGTTYNFRNYFANGGNNFGVQDGSTGNYYIGGGGAGYDGSGVPQYWYVGGLGGGATVNNDPADNTGSGGANNNGDKRGASGIIIIRYRSGTTTTTYTHNSTLSTTLSNPTLGTPSIELVRGTQGDSNTDYKIGNYNGDFIVKSSVSGVDTDYIRIVGTSASIFNSTASPQWSTVSDKRIKENIEKASYDKCFDTINKLELYRFNYIKELNNNNKDKTQLGYIAQEVNDVFPKAVSSYEFNNTMLSIPDLLSIDVAQINYSLYGAVKKLIEINNNKEVRLKKLECILNIECDSSNVAIIEDTITSNIVIVEETITSNIVIEEAMTSNIVVEETMTSNIVVEETMTRNV